MHQPHIQMQGVNISIEMDNAELFDYACEYLRPLITPSSDRVALIIKCSWTEQDWDPEVHLFLTNRPLSRITKRMLGNAHELIWLNTLRMPGLQLRFRRQSDQWVFDVAYYFSNNRDKLEKHSESRFQKYSNLLNYLVYYPVTWYLGATRDWSVLHASVLATEQGGIMVGGLAGAAKTATCFALMRNPRIKLIAENLIFTDGEYIYPCYQPMRVDGHALSLLQLPESLSPIQLPGVPGKEWLLHLNTKVIPDKTKPVLLFLPQFSSRPFLRELHAEDVVEKILAINRLTRELDDYTWYAAALNMHWPKPDYAKRQLQTIHRLTSDIRTFDLGVSRTARPGEAADHILAVLREMGVTE